MSNRLGGKQGTAYTGTNAVQPPNWTFNDRDPNQYDVQNVSLGDLWLNQTNENVWVLVSLAGDMMSKGSLATWTKIDNAGGTGKVDTLTGDTGGAIDPDINSNINLVSGIVGFTFDGNAGTNTITLNSTGGSGDVVQTVVTDAGTAAPVLGVINLISDVAVLNAGSSVLFAAAADTILFDVTDDNFNTIIGKGSGNLTITGTGNSVFGYNSGVALTSGANNLIIGGATGSQLNDGNYNTIIGSGAGNSYTSNESSNVLINSGGDTGESNVLRIGTGTGAGLQQLEQAFIFGIDGITPATADGIPVFIGSAGQLGTVGTGGDTLVSTLTGNSGGAVSPLAGNINIVGDGTSINIVGTPNTLTVSTIGGTSGPSFFAYLSAQTTITPNVLTQIIYDRNPINNGGAFDLGTSTFTAPITGLYNFSCGVGYDFGSSSTPLGYIILVTSIREYTIAISNFANMRWLLGGRTVQLALGNNVYVNMTAGDTAIVETYSSQGAPLVLTGLTSTGAVGVDNFFGGMLV